LGQGDERTVTTSGRRRDGDSLARAGVTVPANIRVGGVPVAGVDAAAVVDRLTFDAAGLVPAVVQDADSRAVLMVAWMDAHAVTATIDEGRTVFWSRSRQQVWRKGETSGDVQHVREVLVDCDGDTLLVLVDQHGDGACHTGAPSCFFRTIDDLADDGLANSDEDAAE